MIRNRQVNFYISALLITVVGTLATVVITRTASEADAFGYTDRYFAPERGDAKTP